MAGLLRRRKRKETMRILAVNGSPRKGGNTQVLLEAVLDGIRGAAHEIEVIRLNDLSFRPCQNCAFTFTI